MATTENFHNGNGGTEFQYTFPVLLDADVKASVDAGSGFVETTAFTLLTSPTRVKFDSAPASGTNNVRIFRDTNVDSAKAVFAAGSSIRAADLNNNMDQVLYSNQEKDRPVATEDIKDDAITSAKIKNGTIVDADVNASAAIAQSKLALDADLTNLSGCQTGASAALALLTSAEVEALDGLTASTAELNIIDGVTATTAELNYTDGVTSNIQTQLDAKQSLDAELTELSTMASGTASALADLSQTEVQIIDGATLSTTELNYVDGVTSAVQTQFDAKQPLDAELTELATMHTDTASALADLTQAEVQILDGATVSTAELNKLDGVTASATDLNIVASMTKQTTISDQDTSYPTSGAVVDYVAGQLEPFGGFELAANRTSFPNTQPVAGVVISITDASGVVFDSTSTPDTTTGNCKTVGNTNVTVQAAPDALQGKTIGAGVGMLVSSTGSGQNYTFHRLLAKDADVEQLSEDIEDFQSRYRVADNEAALTGSDDEGDLYFDKGANKMYVYDGSSWGEVTSTGDFKYLVVCDQNTSNAATYGSATKFDLKENSTSGSLASVTNAAQLMVSINGVVQKPNTGTSIGSNNGFCMEDGHTIVFGGTIVANSDVFVIQSGSALSINTPGDDTVTAAKLNAGTETTGHFLSKTASGSGIAWAAVPAGVGGANGVDFNDNVAVGFGTEFGNTGDTDASIYHDGSSWHLSNKQGHNTYIAGGDTTHLFYNGGGGSAHLLVELNNTKLISTNPIEVWGPDADTGGSIKLFESSSHLDNHVTIEANGTMGANYTFTLPAAVPTANGQALTATTAGVCTWSDVSSTTASGCMYENDQTISAAYTLGANKGAHSVGPITIGNTVTISTNARWVIS